MPARSLWIIFSESSRSPDARVTSHPASDNSPALLRSLWQPVQYRLTSSAWAAAGISAACETAGAMGDAGFAVVDCCATRDTLTAHAREALRRIRFTARSINM